MSIDLLVTEYPGDPAWSRYAATFPEKDQVAALPADTLLNKVLFGEMGDHAAEWMAQPMRALGGQTPAQVLAGHPQGHLAVRSLIMRMPR